MIFFNCTHFTSGRYTVIFVLILFFILVISISRLMRGISWFSGRSRVCSRDLLHRREWILKIFLVLWISYRENLMKLIVLKRKFSYIVLTLCIVGMDSNRWRSSSWDSLKNRSNIIYFLTGFLLLRRQTL